MGLLDSIINRLCWALFPHTGDGKTKKTAILFQGATTEYGHIGLQYAYLAAKEAKPKAQVAILDENGQYAYDWHTTTKGEFWFKFPKELLGKGDGTIEIC